MRRSILPASLVFAAAFLAGCSSSSEEEKVLAVHQSFRQALAHRDFETMKALVPADRRAAFGEGSEALVALAAVFAPPDPVSRGVTVRGDSATIALEAQMEGRPIPGSAVLVREEGAWKLCEERWSIPLGESGNFAGRLVSHPAEKPSVRRSWKAHYGGVTRLAFLPDGERIVSIGINDRRLKLWDGASGNLLSEAETPERPSDMAVISETGEIAIVDAGGQVTLWPLGRSGFGSPRMLAGRSGGTGRIAACPGGSLLATSGYGEPVRLWSPKEGKAIKDLSGSLTMRGVAFSSHGLALAAGGYGNTWKVWNLDPKNLSGRGMERRIPNVSEESDAWSVAWSPDGTLVLTGHMDSSITLWRLGEKKSLLNFYVPDAAVHAVTFAPDGSLFVSGHNDGSIHYWETASGTRLARLVAHEGPVQCLAFSPLDRELLASGGDEGGIVLWQ